MRFWKVKENILTTARKKKPKDIRFVNDFSQRTQPEKHVEKIPEMLEERKCSKTAFIVMDKLIVINKPPDYKKKNRNSNDEDSDIFIKGTVLLYFICTITI